MCVFILRAGSHYYTRKIKIKKRRKSLNNYTTDIYIKPDDLTLRGLMSHICDI